MKILLLSHILALGLEVVSQEREVEEFTGVTCNSQVAVLHVLDSYLSYLAEHKALTRGKELRIFVVLVLLDLNCEHSAILRTEDSQG